MPLDVQSFRGLREFLAAARTLNFRSAAAELDLTPAAVGQAIKALEERVGLALFHRTTRKVALTDAGKALHMHVAPATAEIASALDSLREMRDRVTGKVKVCVHSLALEVVLEPLLLSFHRAYPEVRVEVSVSDGQVNLVEEGFDVDIRIGELIAPDMKAFPVSGELRWVVIGSPSYFREHGKPERPEDLAGHKCILFQPARGRVYRWEFSDKRRLFEIQLRGSIVLDRHASCLYFARHGEGLAYTYGQLASEDIEAGRLEAVLTHVMPPVSYLYLYYSPPSLRIRSVRAFVECARKLSRRDPSKRT